MLQMEGEGEEEDIVCLDESFFIDDNYQLTTFTFGSQVIELLCLQSASTDFDLTGQLVWPGAMLLNDYLSKNAELLQGCTVLELGSGVGITGILCSRFCSKVVLTDHNEEVLKILKKNIELHASSENSKCCSGLVAEKLEWGNSEQIGHILQTYSDGFDLILGADICFQQSSICLLFDTVEKLLRNRREGQCKFILAYVSRTKMEIAWLANILHVQSFGVLTIVYFVIVLVLSLVAEAFAVGKGYTRLAQMNRFRRKVVEFDCIDSLRAVIGKSLLVKTWSRGLIWCWTTPAGTKLPILLFL